MIPKDQREWISLRQVFSASDYPDVSKSEKPDFIIRSGNAVFGVEVTMYYQDKTSGNYANVPHYMHNILQDESNVMKSDKGKLSRVKLGIELDGRVGYIADMVYRAYLPVPERLKRLDDIISDKVNQFADYNNDLEIIDLVIHDQGDLFGGSGGKIIHDYLMDLSEDLLKDLPFRKIYISKKIGSFNTPIILRSSLFVD